MSLADAKPFAVAHWALDEASGTRFDSVGSNDLTDNNTVGSATGMFGNAADFESGNSEYLSVASNTDLSPVAAEDLMVRVWVKLESKSSAGGIVGKWDGSGGNEYLLYYDSSADRFQWFIVQVSGGAISVSANNLGAPSTGTWYLIHAWWSASATEIGIAVNAGAADIQDVGGSFTSFNSVPFEVGRLSGANFLDGLVDDLVLTKDYFLDATERTADYNAGAGVAFANWDAGGGGFVPFPLRGMAGGHLILSGGMFA